MNNKDLMKICKDMQNILFDFDSKDIDGIELYKELTILRNIINDNKTALHILSLGRYVVLFFTLYLSYNILIQKIVYWINVCLDNTI